MSSNSTPQSTSADTAEAPLPLLVDIGANLAAKEFRKDFAQVIARAREVLAHIIVTGSDLASSQQALALSRQAPGLLYATAGIHPHHATQCDTAALAALAALARHPEVRALGETGLDFHRNFSPPKVQEHALEQQLQLAASLGMPVFLHQRDAHRRLHPIVRNYRPQLPAAVVHCFTDQRQALFDYLDLDLYIGITGWICDPLRGSHLHELVGAIPANRLLIESDSPYLRPKDLPANYPLRTRHRNEPCTLPHILRTVAHARGEPAAQLALATTANARRFFSIGQGSG